MATVPLQWPDDGTFHLGINMAGAVSAGAYTAGVLDFLIEALEEWYKQKQPGHPPVPMHKVSIDVFSGASAGGMCAAISAAMVQAPFEHIHQPDRPPDQPTTNKFYDSWVNKIDIEWLLQSNDLQPDVPVVSLLDSTIIDQIASAALTPVPLPNNPDYISNSLTLFLTLTNVRGVPFLLSGDATGSAEEYISYYADRLQFEIVAKAGDAPLFPGAKPLPLAWKPADLPSGVTLPGSWPLLGDAAKATGAFPLFLKPRQVERHAADYMNSPWDPISYFPPQAVSPVWDLKENQTFTTLNVDGGVTDNDPFQLAHDYLAVHNPLAFRDPRTGSLRNPPQPEKANCAVLTVAPFPAGDTFANDYSFDKNSGILGMLPNLFTVLISQSRFLGESLSAVGDGTSFSRFVLAPSDDRNPRRDALQCGLLSAFGGFFERGFRAHDYQLGRRNCQRFLQETFRLSVDNPVIAAGLNAETRDAVIAEYSPEKPETVKTLPIIPLCGSAKTVIPYPERATISSARVGHIVNWIVDRLHAVTGQMLDTTIGKGFESWTLRTGLNGLISTLGKSRLRGVLEAKLRDVIQG